MMAPTYCARHFIMQISRVRILRDSLCVQLVLATITWECSIVSCLFFFVNCTLEDIDCSSLTMITYKVNTENKTEKFRRNC